VVLALALEQDRLAPLGQGAKTVDELAGAICDRLQIGRGTQTCTLGLPEILRHLVRSGFLRAREDHDGAFG